MARSAVDRVRSALEEFLTGEEQARLYRLRAPSDDSAPASRARGRFLASRGGADALEEALELGQLDDESVRALRAHVARLPHTLATLDAGARLRRALAAARLPSDQTLQLPDRLARIARADDAKARSAAARELEHALRPIAVDYVAAHAQAEEPLLVERPKPAAEPATPEPRPSGLLIVSAYSPEALTAAPRQLPDEPWLETARAFLSQTEAAAEQAIDRAARGLGGGGGRRMPWDVLLRGLRAPDLDSDIGRKQRFLRAAAFLRGLGFERDLHARMRGETDRGGALPFAQIVALAVPRDVRVAQIGIDYGVASDVFAAQGVAHALGLALVHTALPPELRWPYGASVAGSFGALALQLWGEPLHLTRVQGLAAAAAERVGRLASAIALLYARACIAIATAPLEGADKPEARCEALVEALSPALCCDVPLSVAGLLGADRVGARARALEALAGFALHPALRERFDDDWFRNPRSAELLRDACMSGNRLTPEALCAELSAPLAAAVPRALELAR